MNHTSRFSIDLAITDGDDVAATLSGDGGQFACVCFDYLDGLGQLARTLAWLIQWPNHGTATVVWEYLGQTWWVFDRDDHTLDVNLLQFQQRQQVLPGGHFVDLFEFLRSALFVRVPFSEFVSQFVRGLEEIGPDSYERRLGEAFPVKEVEELRAFLRHQSG